MDTSKKKSKYRNESYDKNIITKKNIHALKYKLIAYMKKSKKIDLATHVNTKKYFHKQQEVI